MGKYEEFVFNTKNKKIRKKYRWGTILFDVSCGTVNKICDLALVMCILGEASITSGGLAKNFARNAARLAEEYPEVDVKRWLEGFNTLRRKKWLDGSLRVTEEGHRRLEGIIPFPDVDQRWDGVWSVVVFDIPEYLRQKRDILREKLKMLRFGKLQGSVWVSPANFLGTVQKVAEELGISPFVLCSQTSQLGEEGARQLAARVWELEELQHEYKQFLEDVAKKRIKGKSRIFFRYASIVRKDPLLPTELLSKKWVGREAHRYIQSFVAFAKKEQKPSK